MQLILDRSLVDRIVDTWNDSSKVDARVYGHPVFQALHAHAQDFRQKEISAEAYFCELLRLNGMDKERNRDGILRNLRHIEAVDWDEICRDTAGLLAGDSWPLSYDHKNPPMRDFIGGFNVLRYLPSGYGGSHITFQFAS